MKHTKEQKQLINEWLEENQQHLIFIDKEIVSLAIPLKDFQKQHNLIDDELEETFKVKQPHSFCETPEEKCTMNYCDENGCQNRKRNLVFEKIKPAYKSKGGKHGKRIIEELIELGGKNIFNFTAKRFGWYYYIDESNYIIASKLLPQGYTECFLDDELQTITIKIPKGVDYKIEIV
jgi:hypothetical protein